jgi:hypothetical protein
MQILSKTGRVLFETKNDSLCNANLYNANLYNADLAYANLHKANLYNANLCNADLYNANLYNADLCNVNLCNANLAYANLHKANLYNADLYNADLRYANLSNAGLRNANLSNARLPYFQIPQEGSLIVYKKCDNQKTGDCVVKLEIPESARRTASLIGRKCRAECAKVLEIRDPDPDAYFRGIEITEARSINIGEKVTYKVGELVYPNSYCDDIRIECSNGIHFFLTKEEAEDY